MSTTERIVLLSTVEPFTPPTTIIHLPIDLINSTVPRRKTGRWWWWGYQPSPESLSQCDSTRPSHGTSSKGSASSTERSIRRSWSGRLSRWMILRRLIACFEILRTSGVWWWWIVWSGTWTWTKARPTTTAIVTARVRGHRVMRVPMTKAAAQKSTSHDEHHEDKEAPKHERKDGTH